ncbi:MAG TPA: hypothetical protein EYP78_05800 [Candidatus Omnitrophica bacterium]|nr:hypothetical protein [Candidatus Omnitrophota bacterium]
MDEGKWSELAQRIDKLVSSYRKTKRERDKLEKKVEELKNENMRLLRGSKREVLLKDRIKVLEEDRKIIREKVKNLLKIIKELESNG